MANGKCPSRNSHAICVREENGVTWKVPYYKIKEKLELRGD